MSNAIESDRQVKTKVRAKTPEWLLKLRLAFLTDHSPAALKLQSPATLAEITKIEKVQSLSKAESTQSLEFSRLSTQTEKERLSALGFLVAKYEAWSGQQLYPEQLLALIRCIEAYHSPQLKGLIAEMMTSEGKSSTVIPIFVAYAGIGEQAIHVHSVNPHLVSELHTRINRYLVEALGVDHKEIAKLKSMKDSSGQKPQLAKYTVGYWADFIHTYQFSFLESITTNQRIGKIITILLEKATRKAVNLDSDLKNDLGLGPDDLGILMRRINQSLDNTNLNIEDIKRANIHTVGDLISFLIGQKNTAQLFPVDALVICDEIDDTLIDEFTTPAVLTEKSSSALNTIEWLVEIAQFQSQTFDQEGKLNVGVDTRGEVFELQAAEVTPDNGQALYDWLSLALSAVDKIVSNGIKSDDQKLVDILKHRNSRADYLTKTFSQIMFNAVVGSQYLVDKPSDWGEKKYEQADADLAAIQGPFWWDHPELQKAIVGAYILQRGLDYEIFNGEIKPMAKTGYAETGKEYDATLQLVLCVKEGLDLPSSFGSGLPKDNLGAGQFFRSSSKIIGFTGSAAPVAKRLKAGFGLETTQIPPHNPVNRTEKTLVAQKGQEQKQTMAAALVFKEGENRNTLLVAPNTPEAAELFIALSQKNQQQAEIRLLSANNEQQDKEFYDWLAENNDGKRHILVTARMVGRGVNIRPKPNTPVQTLDMLMVATFLPESIRALHQLVSRIGRCGDKGEAITIASPDDPIWETLSKKDAKEIQKAIAAQDTNRVAELTQKARENYESMATTLEQLNNIFYAPIIELRKLVAGYAQISNQSTENHPKPWLKFATDSFKQFLCYTVNPAFWPKFIYLADKVFWQNVYRGGMGDLNSSSLEASWRILVFKVAQEASQQATSQILESNQRIAN